MRDLISYLRGLFHPATPALPPTAIDPQIKALADEALALLEPAYLRSLFPRQDERFVITLVVNKFLALDVNRFVSPEDVFGPADSAEEQPASPARKAQPAHTTQTHVFGPRCEETDRHRLRSAPPPALFCYVIDGTHHHVCGYHHLDDTLGHSIKNCPLVNPTAEAQA